MDWLPHQSCGTGNLQSTNKKFGRTVNMECKGCCLPNSVEQQITNAKYVGVVYTQWGKATCLRKATLVYFGRAARAHYSHPGTRHQPQLQYSSNWCSTCLWGQSMKCGLILQTITFPVLGRTKRSFSKIICPSQWTQEYKGYIMTLVLPHLKHLHA